MFHFLFLRCMGGYTATHYWRIKYITKINLSNVYNYDLIPAEKAYERVDKLETKIKELKSTIFELSMTMIESNPEYKKDVELILRDNPELYKLIKKEL